MKKVTFKKIAAGCYRTEDGAFDVQKITLPHNGQTRWYWKPVDGDAEDHYYTKREAVEALTAWINGD